MPRDYSWMIKGAMGVMNSNAGYSITTTGKKVVILEKPVGGLVTINLATDSWDEIPGQDYIVAVSTVSFAHQKPEGMEVKLPGIS